MIKVIVTNAVISKGYEDKPALHFTQKDGTTTFVRFRIGNRVFDKDAENNTRWVNHAVKAFGKLAERIENMKLAAGSFVNLSGRLDEETWDDNGTTRRAPIIVIDEIEYAGGNGEKKNENSQASTPEAAAAGSPPSPAPEGSGSFAGFTSASGGNDYF